MSQSHASERGKTAPNLQIWDLREGQLMYTLHAHRAPVLTTAFALNGDYFATAGADKQVSCPNINL